MSMVKPLALYLHIPFCKHRCAYCDFNTYTTLGTLQNDYALALESEISTIAVEASAAGQMRPIHSIFFGGGTPSLMSISALQRLLSTVQSTFGITSATEITLEANPDTVDREYLRGLKAVGINRLSFGVQSAQQNELALLERTHDFETVVTVVNEARDAGFGNFNLDLIYGLPGQSLKSWQRSVEAVLALDPPHLSLYCLTIEPGTPMRRWLENGRIAAPDPDLAAEQYAYACRELESRGLNHYEISNWAMPGYECQHNLTYWRNQEYLGLGAGAHGQANGFRYAVVKRPRVYIRRINEDETGQYPLSAAVADYHQVDRDEAMSDTVITQLRLLEEGLDLADFARRFGQSLDEAYPGLVTQMIEWGLLKSEGSRLRLTNEGLFISNQVFYRFV